MAGENMKKYLQNNKIIIPALIAVIVVLFAIGILTAPKKAEAPEEPAAVGSEESTYPSSYRIENVRRI